MVVGLSRPEKGAHLSDTGERARVQALEWVAVQKAVGSRRAAWRNIASVKLEEKIPGERAAGRSREGARRESGSGSPEHLWRHPPDDGREPHPIGKHGRVGGVLLQVEERLLPTPCRRDIENDFSREAHPTATVERDCGRDRSGHSGTDCRGGECDS